MMKFKNRYSGIIMRDKYSQSWTKICLKSKKLHEICDVIFSWIWPRGRSSVQKHVKEAADALLFLRSPAFTLSSYILLTIFSDEAIQKFLSQVRESSSGNF